MDRCYLSARFKQYYILSAWSHSVQRYITVIELEVIPKKVNLKVHPFLNSVNFSSVLHYPFTHKRTSYFCDLSRGSRYTKLPRINRELLNIMMVLRLSRYEKLGTFHDSIKCYICILVVAGINTALLNWFWRGIHEYIRVIKVFSKPAIPLNFVTDFLHFLRYRIKISVELDTGDH